ncbi:hypothetical protein QNI16_03450 [Cytophagaceae bacterium YF14B1]|uniref:Adhesin domain-containing protein n=1 Tax=Xanthocytophaga flava TaxID=3048013 RepID=A0AAE3U7C4_9BACT|nr:hypothetical protein [Xanthocytophaga flavus]MDJ1479524.1 hypothetical protein [Xanthocytophaga flavus]
MKTIAKLCLAGLVLCQTHWNAFAQTQQWKERVTKTFTLSKEATATTLAVYNITGFIRVEGYAGSQVQIEVDKELSAKDVQMLEQGKKEFKLQFDQNADSIVAYIAAPYDSRPNRNCCCCDNRSIRYHYTLDFTIKVPYSMNLHVSTVNQGDVAIKDVTGILHAYNVNGPITLTNAKGATDVRTINGDVEINYISAPPEQSSYYTLNGDIRIIYPASLSALLEFKSFQGEFYTDFPNVEVLPAHIIKNEEKKVNSTIYKLTKNTSMRVGKGGKTFFFETFNGNIYIKKQS